jgi:hypothetical protein
VTLKVGDLAQSDGDRGGRADLAERSGFTDARSSGSSSTTCGHGWGTGPDSPEIAMGSPQRNCPTTLVAVQSQSRVSNLDHSTALKLQVELAWAS